MRCASSAGSGRALAAWTLLACAACTRPSVPPSAVLLTLDTTRADALGCYSGGGAESLTPALDRLARESVRFSDAHTAAPITLVAHASMLTGLYPVRHTVRDNALWPLPSEALTLAELAAERGVQTAAFVASIVLDRSYGLAQGFEHWEQPEARTLRASSHAVELPARAVVAAAVDWLHERDRTRPMFLWVHLFDPHGPYRPPERYSRGRFARRHGYDGEVAAMDEEIGRFLREIERDGDLDRTTILVVADHGEAFGEHGEISHGAYTFETTLRVPMLLRRADGARAGEVSDEVVSVVDVFPTLAEALGLPETPGLDGLSLYGSHVPADRGVYFESYQGYLSFHWSPLAGWLDANGKYVHGSRDRFCVLGQEGAEERDRAGELPELVRGHRDALEAVARLPRLRRAQPSAAGSELVKGIRALGYATVEGEREALPEPGATSDLPDPLDRTDEYRRTLTALELNNAGRFAEAERLFREILAENPSSFFALDRLGFALIGQERWAEAIEPLETMVARGPKWSHSWLNLGFARAETGDLAGAAEAFAGALDCDPGAKSELRAYLDRLHRTGRLDLEAELREAVADLLDAEDF